MALSTQPYKGARDFYPEDKQLQKQLFAVMRQVAERYGYEEYDAPIIEPLELYLAKTSQEVVNEQTYAFTDRGGRQVTIRPEMTPSVSRMVAGRRQELAYPLRWYSIPNLWRYERPQRGRLREHWQLNVDVFGIDNLTAEHELIMLANDILGEFGAQPAMFTIRLNSRQLVDSYLTDVLHLDDTQKAGLIRLIDRMHKLDQSEFNAQVEALLSPSQRAAATTGKLFDFLNTASLDELEDEIGQLAAAQRLRQLADMLASSGVSNAVFDPTLMRGFDYYTDIVFEVFDKHPDNNRSMFGGGRYDGLVGQFGVEPLPTVGFGMGDVTLQNFLEAHQLLPAAEDRLDLYAVLIGDTYLATQPYLARLRQAGLKVAVDSSGRKPDKQTKTANKKQAPFVMYIGEQELERQQFEIKQLADGQTSRLDIDGIIKLLRNKQSR